MWYINWTIIIHVCWPFAYPVVWLTDQQEVFLGIQSVSKPTVRLTPRKINKLFQCLNVISLLTSQIIIKMLKYIENKLPDYQTKSNSVLTFPLVSPYLKLKQKNPCRRRYNIYYKVFLQAFLTLSLHCFIFETYTFKTVL